MSQRGFWGMWVGTLVVAAAALVLALRNHNQADVTQGALREESVASVPSQPQPASPSEPAAVKEPSPVTLLLEAQPAHAQWFVDDGPALGNPVRLQVDRDSQKHRLRVAAEGYLAQEREVEFRDNLTLALALAAEPEQKKLRRRVPQLTKRREVQEVPPASSAAGQPTSSPAPSARTQPTPRELDTDNPFRAQ